jgi:hypothetical protein
MPAFESMMKMMAQLQAAVVDAKARSAAMTVVATMSVEGHRKRTNRMYNVSAAQSLVGQTVSHYRMAYSRWSQHLDWYAN